MLCCRGWYALQVRSLREKTVAACLTGKGYEIFLPSFLNRQGKSAPLFPGYLFCRVSGVPVGKIVTTPSVIRIVGTGAQPAIVDADEIERIRQVISSGLQRYPWQYIPNGCSVRISSGPLTGIEGILVADQGTNRLIVSISLLQRSVAAVLDQQTLVVPLSDVSPDTASRAA
jgi:transcription antitermination factor NusG